ISNASKGNFGELYVAKYLARQGYEVEVSTKNGSDLVARKGRKSICIEVKTTQNLKGGIPDMFVTEFIKKKGKWLFVADYLYVLRIDKKGKPFQLDILSKKEIDKYSATHRTVTRIRTTKLDLDLFKG